MFWGTAKHIRKQNGAWRVKTTSCRGKKFGEKQKTGGSDATEKFMRKRGPIRCGRAIRLRSRGRWGAGDPLRREGKETGKAGSESDLTFPKNASSGFLVLKKEGNLTAQWKKPSFHKEEKRRSTRSCARRVRLMRPRKAWEAQRKGKRGRVHKAGSKVNGSTTGPTKKKTHAQGQGKLVPRSSSRIRTIIMGRSSAPSRGTGGGKKTTGGEGEKKRGAVGTSKLDQLGNVKLWKKLKDFKKKLYNVKKKS